MREDNLNNLIDSYGDELYKFCYHLARNRVDADDLYQDTFLKAIQLRHRLVGSGNVGEQYTEEEANRKNRNFMMGIAVNLWKNQSRRNNRRRSMVNIDEYTHGELQIKSNENVENDSLRREVIKRLNDHIDNLPDKLKVVVCMYYTAEMKTGDIAKILHVPSGTVKSRLHLARKQLKRSLEADGYEI